MRKKAENAFSKINQKQMHPSFFLPLPPVVSLSASICLPTPPDPASSSHLKAICVQKQLANRQTNKQTECYKYTCIYHIHIHIHIYAGIGTVGRGSGAALQVGWVHFGFRWLCALGRERERSERILRIEWAKQCN